MREASETLSVAECLLQTGVLELVFPSAGVGLVLEFEHSAVNAHIHTQPRTHVTAAHEPVDLAVVAEYCRTADCALRDAVALGAQEVSAATAMLSEARRLVGQYKVRASPVDGRAESDAVGLLVLRCPTPSCHPLAWPR